MNRTAEARVLHVLEATLGGTMRYLENVLSASYGPELAMGFAYATVRADHQLEPMLERARRSGWQLYPIDMCREISPLQDARSLLELLRIVRQFRPTILHCHSSKAGGLGRLASLLMWPRPQIVYSPHALSAGSHIHLWIEQALKFLTNEFVAVSDSERQQILSHRLAAPNRVDVLYPVVEVDYFQPRSQDEARHYLGLPVGPVVVSVGRLTAQKNPLRFLQIIHGLKSEVPDVFAIWVGDGELREKFVSEQRRLGLAGCVSLAGWQSDVRPYFAASDVVLSASEFESFGYIVAEALSMERPVVASRVCGTVDILRGELAVNLFDTADEAVYLLAKLLFDERLAGRIAKHGRLEVRNRFGAEQMRHKLPLCYGLS